MIKIKNIHPAYGAVLLLLAGQLVLGAQERKQAQLFNQCVRYTQLEDVLEGKNSWNFRGWPVNTAVAYCHGGR